MGRKAGGKNFGNFIEASTATTVEQEISAGIVNPEEKKTLSEIFTCIHKDFISIKDFMEFSGLSYTACAEIIREIKAVSDTFKISGYIHRTDYYAYLSRKFAG